MALFVPVSEAALTVFTTLRRYWRHRRYWWNAFLLLFRVTPASLISLDPTLISVIRECMGRAHEHPDYHQTTYHYLHDRTSPLAYVDLYIG
jgi:hypothetical protein